MQRLGKASTGGQSSLGWHRGMVKSRVLPDHAGSWSLTSDVLQRSIGTYCNRLDSHMAFQAQGPTVLLQMSAKSMRGCCQECTVL